MNAWSMGSTVTAPAADRALGVLDTREGFYMVRTAAIEALRATLAGAPLASSLGASVILARQCRRSGGSPVSGEQCCELRLEGAVSTAFSAVQAAQRYCSPWRASRTSVTASGKTTAITARI
jgi:hypothetical protein